MPVYKLGGWEAPGVFYRSAAISHDPSQSFGYPRSKLLAARPMNPCKQQMGSGEDEVATYGVGP